MMRMKPKKQEFTCTVLLLEDKPIRVPCSFPLVSWSFGISEPKVAPRNLQKRSDHRNYQQEAQRSPTRCAGSIPETPSIPARSVALCDVEMAKMRSIPPGLAVSITFTKFIQLFGVPPSRGAPPSFAFHRHPNKLLFAAPQFNWGHCQVMVPLFKGQRRNSLFEALPFGKGNMHNLITFSGTRVSPKRHATKLTF